jgi:peptide methionine sulfoxide reductase MsrB
MKRKKVIASFTISALLTFGLIMILSLQVKAPQIARSNASNNCQFNNELEVTVSPSGPCTELSDALDSISTGDHVTIKLMSGTYTTSSATRLNTINVTIEGDHTVSNSDIRLLLTGSLDVTNSIVSLSWITIDGDSTNALIQADDNSKLSVIDSKITNKNGSVIAAQNATQVLVDSSYISDSKTGIIADSVSDLEITNTQFVKNEIHLLLSQTNSILSKNLFMQSAKNAISLVYPGKTLIQETTISDSKQAAIYTSSDTGGTITVNKTLFISNEIAVDSTLSLTGSNNNFWKNNVDEKEKQITHTSVDPKVGIFYCLKSGSPMILSENNFIGYPRFNNPICTEE